MLLVFPLQTLFCSMCTGCLRHQFNKQLCIGLFGNRIDHVCLGNEVQAEALQTVFYQHQLKCLFGRFEQKHAFWKSHVVFQMLFGWNYRPAATLLSMPLLSRYLAQGSVTLIKHMRLHHISSIL